MGRFETETLIQEDNLKGLARMNCPVGEKAGAMAHTLTPASDLWTWTVRQKVQLHASSSVRSRLQRAGFECVCGIIPSFCSTMFARLRRSDADDPGTSPASDGWQELLEPVVKGYQKKGLPLAVPG